MEYLQLLRKAFELKYGVRVDAEDFVGSGFRDINGQMCLIIIKRINGEYMHLTALEYFGISKIRPISISTTLKFYLTHVHSYYIGREVRVLSAEVDGDYFVVKSEHRLGNTIVSTTTKFTLDDLDTVLYKFAESNLGDMSLVSWYNNQVDVLIKDGWIYDDSNALDKIVCVINSLK